MVKDSFKPCSFSTSTDDCEEDSIHYLKPGRPCEARRKVLIKEMEKFVPGHGRESSEDPFALDDDGEDYEKSEDISEDDDDDDGDGSNTTLY